MGKHFKIIVDANHNFRIDILRDTKAHVYEPTRASRVRLEQYFNTHKSFYTPYYVFCAHNIYVEFKLDSAYEEKVLTNENDVLPEENEKIEEILKELPVEYRGKGPYSEDEMKVFLEHFGVEDNAPEK